MPSSGIGGGILLESMVGFPGIRTAVPGPEEYLAGRPMLVVTAIALQIAATLTLVGIFSRRSRVEVINRA